MKVLVVEDGDAKYRNVLKVVITIFGDRATVVRASTARAAERAIEEERWDLIVLDVSLDITESSLSEASGGHATLGGLAVAEKMYLLGLEAPTIVVTAFDAFQARASTSGSDSIVGLEHVDAYSRQTLGGSYLGYVRYGDIGWQDTLADKLRHFSTNERSHYS